MFSVTLVAGNTYSWTTGSAIIDSGAGTSRIMLRWQNSAIDTVQIKVTNSAGCASEYMLIITAGSTLIPTIIANPSTRICEGDTITLDAGGGYASYRWNTGAVTQKITIGVSGAYSVDVQDAGGCSGSSQPITITVNQKPLPSISADRVNLCSGDSVHLSSDSMFASYQWLKDGKTIGNTTRFLTVGDSGKYALLVITPQGCKGVSLPLAIGINVPVKPKITGNDSILTSTQALSYQWYRNDTLLPGDTGKQLITNLPGKYTIQVVDSNGCKVISDPYNLLINRVSTVITLNCPLQSTYEAGQEVIIPLILSSSFNLRSNGPEQFMARVRFRKNVLYPLFATTQQTNIGDERAITFASNRANDLSQGSLMNMPFQILLGDTACTQVTLDSLWWTDGAVQVSLVNPACEICVKVCREGGTRLFLQSGKLNLLQNHPNPFNAMTVIEYELIENGYTELYVTDILGRKVASLLSDIVHPGKYVVQYDANILPSGTYLYVLQTPSEHLYKLMEVVK